MPLAAPTGGEIRADAAYALPDFMRITGQGAKSIRKAKREGLKVVRSGRRSYVIGQSWLDYLARAAK